MKNKVELIGYYGSDEIHAQDWVILPDSTLNSIDKILNYYVDTKRYTHFKKSMFHFKVSCDIYSYIHILKNINSKSIFHNKINCDNLNGDKCYYLPEDINNIQSNQNIISAYDRWTYTRENDYVHTSDNSWSTILNWYTTLGNQLYNKCLNELSETIGDRAYDVASFFKTTNNQLSLYITLDMYSFYKFQNSAINSSDEVRNLCELMLNSIKNIEGNPFKYTIESFKV